MNRYFGLLSTIATAYNIKKGSQEDETAWKARVMYSLLGQTGYSALYDIQDDLAPVSITHFKRRMSSLLESLLSMYPEMQGFYRLDDDSLYTEIYTIYISTGYIYHEPNRLVPCVRKIARGDRCSFMRGQTIEEDKWVSGLGCYLPVGKLNETSYSEIEDMFQLQNEPLVEFWNRLLSEANFRELPSGINLQYLRVVPPYRSGYWSENPDNSGDVSLARSDNPGGRLYFLYRNNGKTAEISSLPSWLTEGYEYRKVAVACLASRGTLPSSTYSVAGDLVTLKIGYLFPPAELNLIKLFSWPTSYSDFPHDFTRIIDLDVFEEIRAHFDKLGYRFKEG